MPAYISIITVISVTPCMHSTVTNHYISIFIVRSLTTSPDYAADFLTIDAVNLLIFYFTLSFIFIGKKRQRISVYAIKNTCIFTAVNSIVIPQSRVLRRNIEVQIRWLFSAHKLSQFKLLL